MVKQKKIKNCSFCEKEFKPYTSLDKFCSVKCRIEKMKSKKPKKCGAEQVKKRKVALTPQYVNGLSTIGSKVNADGVGLFQKNSKELRESMLNEYGYLFCENCNLTSKKLECHHIIYRSEKPSHEHLHCKENILMVCVPCHNKFHTNKGLRNEIVEKRGLNLLFGNDVLNK